MTHYLGSRSSECAKLGWGLGLLWEPSATIGSFRRYLGTIIGDWVVKLLLLRCEVARLRRQSRHAGNRIQAVVGACIELLQVRHWCVGGYVPIRLVWRRLLVRKLRCLIKTLRRAKLSLLALSWLKRSRGCEFRSVRTTRSFSRSSRFDCFIFNFRYFPFLSITNISTTAGKLARVAQSHEISYCNLLNL